MAGRRIDCPGPRKDQSWQSIQSADQLVGILRDTVVALVRRDGPDLSARQLGVFLTCYLQDGGHTVRGLAAELNVSKPAITRALDRLGELDLARRKVDPMDRRSVLVQRTLKGTAFLRDLRAIMGEPRLPEEVAAGSRLAYQRPPPTGAPRPPDPAVARPPPVRPSMGEGATGRRWLVTVKLGGQPALVVRGLS